MNPAIYGQNLAPVASLPSEGLFTPDAILTVMGELGAAIRSLGKELFNHSDVDGIDDFLDGWNIFVDSWDSFKDEHSSAISRVWDSTRDQLLVYGKNFNGQRDAWAALFPATAIGRFDVAPPEATGPLSAAANALDNLGQQTGVALKHVLAVAAIVVGLAGAGYVAYRVIR